jgi:hypothetical protein
LGEFFGSNLSDAGRATRNDDRLALHKRIHSVGIFLEKLPVGIRAAVVKEMGKIVVWRAVASVDVAKGFLKA